MVTGLQTKQPTVELHHSSEGALPPRSEFVMTSSALLEAKPWCICGLCVGDFFINQSDKRKLAWKLPRRRVDFCVLDVRVEGLIVVEILVPESSVALAYCFPVYIRSPYGYGDI